MPIASTSVPVLRDPSADGVRARRTRGPLVVLSDDSTLVLALASNQSTNGWALLPRSAGADAIEAALRAVETGLVVLTASALPTTAATPSPARLAARGELDEVERLTARERDVLQLVAEGLHNRAIAEALGISDHTVKFHLASIFGKLGVSTRTGAARVGLRRGLVQV